MVPFRVLDTAEIQLFTVRDEITLEYKDRILLRFTPDFPGLEGALESIGEFIRINATIHILDKDCKQILLPAHYVCQLCLC